MVWPLTYVNPKEMKQVITMVYSHPKKKEQVIYDPLNTGWEEKENHLCHQNVVNICPNYINLKKHLFIALEMVRAFDHFISTFAAFSGILIIKMGILKNL